MAHIIIETALQNYRGKYLKIWKTISKQNTKLNDGIKIVNPVSGIVMIIIIIVIQECY